MGQKNREAALISDADARDRAFAASACEGLSCLKALATSALKPGQICYQINTFLGKQVFEEKGTALIKLPKSSPSYTYLDHLVLTSIVDHTTKKRKREEPPASLTPLPSYQEHMDRTFWATLWEDIFPNG